MISNRTSVAKRALTLGLAAPLAMMAAACNGEEAAGTGSASSGEAIAAIPAPQGQNWNDVVNVSEEGGYIVGNPDAPLKLVEYASHTCGACAHFAQTGKAPLKNDYISTGVVSFEQRNLVRDTFDLVIATLVRCGANENMQPLSDQAWQNFNEVMNTAQQNNQAINAAGSLPLEQRMVAIGEASGIIDFFSARGLSADQARTCLADIDNIEAIAERSQQQAQELEVIGTPTFFLNGRRLEGNQWPQIEVALQEAGARTK